MKASRRRSRSVGLNEPEKLDRWMVSYADFITLLLAFFVVMYALSSVNEAKYRTFTQAMTLAFKENKWESPDPSVISPETAGSQQLIVLSPFDPKGSGNKSDGAKSGGEQPHAEEADRVRLEEQLVREQVQLDEVMAYMQTALEGFVKKNNELIEITRKDYAIELDVKSGLLFQSGSSALANTAQPLLNQLAVVLAKLPNNVQVEGHTDNRPISSREFPSNWELSSARAASVVHYLASMGVAPERMVAMGYGEFHPIADNQDEQGRYKNRRVLISVISGSATDTLKPAPH